NLALLAMIREQGDVAWTRGDRAGAEAAWTRMLETVIEPPDRKPRKPKPAASPSPAARPAAASGPSRATSMGPRPNRSSGTGSQPAKAASKKANAAAPPDSNLPILTLDRFEQAMQVARLAAERELPELNYRAVREALRAGPPVVPTNPNAERRALMMAQRGME